MEQLAQLAEQQGALSGETGGLLPLMPQGGEELLRQLQGLAQQQRSLANELERLDAGGQVSGTDELAREAEEVAEEMEAGRLDREVVERQEQLFRRLLDAGRTLRSDEEDDREERQSRTADPSNVRLPPATGPAAEPGPRFRYPTWEALRQLSPEERRMILDYFRRLNAQRRGSGR